MKRHCQLLMALIGPLSSAAQIAPLSLPVGGLNICTGPETTSAF
jgi:hypothetical protein